MDDFRIVAQVGLSDELWRFLVEAGLRKATYSPDRRHYRDVPSTFVTRLSNATASKWQALLLAALREASRRPRIRIITRSESVS